MEGMVDTVAFCGGLQISRGAAAMLYNTESAVTLRQRQISVPWSYIQK
jgi:hypothetical protein